MHALRHVHRLLVPGGTLVVLHPVTESRVEASGRPVGVIKEPQWANEDLPNAEARLEQAVADGLFVLEAETEFELLSHFDTAADLLDVRIEDLAEQPALAEKIHAAGAPLQVRDRLVLRRLRAANLEV